MVRGERKGGGCGDILPRWGPPVRLGNLDNAGTGPLEVVGF